MIIGTIAMRPVDKASPPSAVVQFPCTLASQQDISYETHSRMAGSADSEHRLSQQYALFSFLGSDPEWQRVKLAYTDATAPYTQPHYHRPLPYDRDTSHRFCHSYV